MIFSQILQNNHLNLVPVLIGLSLLYVSYTIYTSIDLKESSTKMVSHGVPQGSVLGPLLFIIFINDLNKSVKHSKVHHYADDTHLLLTEKSLKKINKQVNQDLALI